MTKLFLAVVLLQLAVVAQSWPIIAVGGEADDVPSDDLKWMAIKEINAKSKDPENYVPVKITKATAQVVAGTLHTFDIEVAQADCLKTKVHHEQLVAKPCKLKVKGKKQVHSVKIHLAVPPAKNQVTILSSKNL